MKLLGNSVSVPVIDKLCKAIIETGVFENDQSIDLKTEDQLVKAFCSDL
jgi:DNA (cytosine-5)-methyltransferase 1